MVKEFFGLLDFVLILGAKIQKIDRCLYINCINYSFLKRNASTFFNVSPAFGFSLFAFSSRAIALNQGYLLTDCAIKPLIVAEQKLTKPDLVESFSLETRAGQNLPMKNRFCFSNDRKH
ncbi:hypothetical protein [Pedobacter frigiditerrae]|uniref:hypothetical protein n=1 Tax=Pedobacter frigiditerrae TaxID=2530452 RepID=UPI0029314DCB|nr:hypothetical protein [Pedobacter frigiditerrae]